MDFNGEITLEPDMAEKLKAVCNRRGISDISEFITNLITNEIQQDLEEMAIEEELRGLGYAE